MNCHRVILFALGGFIGIGTAQAGLTLSLEPATQNAVAGTEVVFSGALTNTSATEKLFLNDIQVMLSGQSASQLTLKSNTFFAHVPGILLPGETYHGPLFRIAVTAGAPSADYPGTIIIGGGTDIFAAMNVASATFMLTVLEGSATVTVVATDATAGEPLSGFGTGTLTFSRTGSTAASLTVNTLVGGTATSGSDYTAMGTAVTFAAGSATTTQTVSVIDDLLTEGDETVVVTLASGGGYTVGSPSSATVTIRDDDASSSDVAYVTSTLPGTLRNNYSGWVGMQIAVGANPLTITQLGRLMAPGNSGTHPVKLVKASDGTDVPGGMVAIGMSGGTLGEFRYGVLSSPVTLAAGTAYLVLSQETADGDSWYNWDTQLTTTAVAVDNAVAWGTGPGDWNTYAIANRAHVPLDFKYGGTVVPVDRTLMVASSNPNNGVGIMVSPADKEGFGNGLTAFTRTYASNTVVTLTAAATAGANSFQKWQKDGQDWSTNLSTTATMDANHTLTAVYGGAETAYVTSVVLGTLRNNYSGWVGIQIVVGADPLTVSQLGRMMALGNSGTHALKLVKSSDGTDVPGSSVMVAMSGGTVDQFRYGVLSSPVTLSAGTAYLVLSEETAGGDTWYDWNTQLTTTGVAVDNAVAWGTRPGDWNTYAIGNRAHVPVDFKYGSTAVPVGRTLTVGSSNPASGVGIAVSPADNGGFGDGITAFTRSYNGNTVVTLTAPATAAGNTFQKWQKDGVDWSANLSTTAMMDANHTMTAVYGGAETAYVTSVVLGTLRNNYSGWVGIQIVVGANPVTVSKLGRMMAPGNSGTHALKLVKSSDGTDVPEGSVTVAMNGGTVGQFLYGVLNSPVTLAAGTTYLVLSQETAGGDTWYDWDTQLTTTGVAVDNAVAWGTGPGDWNTYGVANRAHVPVDFKY